MQAEELVAKLEPVVLSFTRKSGETGHLFGSVTSADIAAELAAKGFEVDRRKISSPSRSRPSATHAWPSSCTAKSPRT